jgi:FixJ family two-component response regulator
MLLRRCVMVRSTTTIEIRRSRMMEKMGAVAIAQLVRMFMDFEHSAGGSH